MKREGVMNYHIYLSSKIVKNSCMHVSTWLARLLHRATESGSSRSDGIPHLVQYRSLFISWCVWTIGVVIRFNWFVAHPLALKRKIRAFLFRFREWMKEWMNFHTETLRCVNVNIIGKAIIGDRRWKEKVVSFVMDSGDSRDLWFSLRFIYFTRRPDMTRWFSRSFRALIFSISIVCLSA